MVFILLALWLAPLSCEAKTFEAATESESDYTEAKVVYSPEPEIPSEKREQCLKTYCQARFYIDPEGKQTVKLLTKSGSNEIDDITLSTLKRWKFKPAMLDGKAVESTRRIKVEFEIE